MRAASVPTILRSWVRIPSTPSTLFSFYLYCWYQHIYHNIETAIVIGMRKGRKWTKKMPALFKKSTFCSWYLKLFEICKTVKYDSTSILYHVMYPSWVVLYGHSDWLTARVIVLPLSLYIFAYDTFSSFKFGQIKTC